MMDPIAEEKQAWEEYRELCGLVKNDIRNVIRIGQILKNLQDTQRYKKLGDGGYETWESFIADPMLKMSRSYVFQHIQMFSFYVIEMQLPIEEIEKITSIHLMGDCMRYIIRHNLSREEAVEVITKAQSLSLSDFTKEVKEKEGLLEGQVEQPQEQLAASTGQSEEQPRDEAYQKLHVERCDMCNKQRVDYFEDQICQCDGVFHLTNKTLKEQT